MLVCKVFESDEFIVVVEIAKNSTVIQLTKLDYFIWKNAFDQWLEMP